MNESKRKLRAKTFPCPVCKGSGYSDIEYYEFGTNYVDCLWCKDGAIEVGSKMHMKYTLCSTEFYNLILKHISGIDDEDITEEELERQNTGIEKIRNLLRELWEYDKK